MSQVLTVPTHFRDIAELSEGFLDRVEQDTLILYGPVPYEDGSEIDFAILLADGTAAIEGRGRVRAAVDGGDERMPETRYDVVLGALHLDGRYEVIFESLVLARQAVSERPSAADDPVEAGADPHDVEEGTDPHDDDLVGLDGSEAYLVEPTDDDQGASTQSEALSDASTAEADEDPPQVMGTDDEGAVVDSLGLDKADAEVESLAPEEVIVALESLSPEEAEETVDSLSPEDALAAVDSLSPDEGDDEELASPSQDELEEPVESFSSELGGPAAPGAADSDRIIAEGAADWDDASDWGDEPSIHATLDADRSSSTPAEAPEAAKPPSEPPAPPELHLERAPDGLTRPSRVQAPDSDQPPAVASEPEPASATGLFQYDEKLPIPSRPPLPDLDPARRISAPEAIDSEPPELEFTEDDADEDEEDYEEVLLADTDDQER